MTSSAVPGTVLGITDAIAVSASGGTPLACALLGNGSIQCWGTNDHGALGDGTSKDSSTPVTVTGITNAIAVSSAYNRACALLGHGEVQCWGVWGHGTGYQGCCTRSTAVPETMSGVADAIAVATDLDSAYVILAAGTRHGPGSGKLVPVTTSVTAVAAGLLHDCAIVDQGSVMCWGYNGAGELGDGTTEDSISPVRVQGF